MSNYRVLKDFVNKSGTLSHEGDIYKATSLGPFTKSLLEFGYIEPAQRFISNLARVEIAPKDYTEGDKKHFNFDEACKIEDKLKNGWRLPTRHEWSLICEEYSLDEDGDLSYSKLHESLDLNLNGYVYPWNQQLRHVGAYGCYWSSTASTAANGFNLGFIASGVYPSYSNNRAYGLSVRLVRDLEE